MGISQLNERSYISTLWLRMREQIQGQGLDNVNVEPIRHWLKLGDQQMCNGWLIPDFRFHSWLTRMSMEVIGTIVSKLVYKLFMGLTTYVYRGTEEKKRHVGSFWPTLTELKKTDNIRISTRTRACFSGGNQNHV